MNWILTLLGIAPSPSSIRLGSGKSSQGGKPRETLSLTERLTFEETVTHLNRGYENVQKVAQFMEAKAAAVVTFSLVLFGFVGKVVAWAHTSGGSGVLVKSEYPKCCFFSGLAILVIIHSIGGIVCFRKAFNAIRPNPLPDPTYFTTLFPVLTNPEINPEVNQYLAKVVEGETHGFVVEEYRLQLLAMGGVVDRKISFLRSSMRALWFQGICAVLIGTVIGAGVAFGLV